MTIDLMELAKKADETYLDVETTFGTLRVYHVPDVLYLSVSPDRVEPELPMVRMKTATGYQERPAKRGDSEYEEYQRDRTAYDEESTSLNVAIGMVGALKDIDWSEYDLTGPPPIKDAIELYADNWPERDLLRKRIWLDWTVFFKSADRDTILEAINRMRGDFEPTDAMVDEVKKNSDSSSEPSQND